MNVDAIVSFLLPEAGIEQNITIKLDYAKEKLFYVVLVKNIIPILSAFLVIIVALFLFTKKGYIIDVTISPNSEIKLGRHQTIIVLVTALCISLFVFLAYLYEIVYALGIK